MRFSELGANQLVVKLRRIDTVLLCEAQSIQEVVLGLSGRNFKTRKNSNPDISITDCHGKSVGFMIVDYDEFYKLVLQRLGRVNNRFIIPEVGSDAMAGNALKSFIKQDIVQEVVAEMRSLSKKIKAIVKFRELPDNLAINIDEMTIELPAIPSGLRVLKFKGMTTKIYFVYYITSETMVDLMNGDILYFSPMHLGPFIQDNASDAYIGKRKYKPDMGMYRSLMQILPTVYTSGWQEFRSVLQNWLNV